MKAPVLGMVLKGYPRISETFIANEILLLEKLGLDIRIFSMRHPREQFWHDSIKNIKARVDYLPTELLLDFPRLLLPGSLEAVRQPPRFLAALKKAGERYYRTRNPATIKHLLQGAFLVNRYLRPSPEVVHLHAHFAHSPSSVALFAAMLSGLRFSFTAHAKDIYTSDAGQLREKIMLASHVVTCTRYNQQYLGSLFNGDARPIYCVYHGIDLQLFKENTESRQPRPPFRILTVARLTAKKGIPTILQALSILRDRGIDFQYTLIGDGEDRDTLLEMIGGLGLKEHCRWKGTLTHDQVLHEFRQADVFVLGCEIAPNGDRDGIPNVLVESLAMGLPAAGTTVSALPEILLHGETGLITQPGNPVAMAENILRLLTDPELRHKVIRRGRNLVGASFDNRRLIKDLAKIYCRNIPSLHCS
ncbi:MAG: glycosyltransferase family 4 protein [Desulfobulbaceae bacterium]|nr:glycosyltransferase family 4 protein [Desulfobulbaceae bacterium]